MTTSIIFSAVVGGSASFLVAALHNFYRAARNRKRAVSESNSIWD